MSTLKLVHIVSLLLILDLSSNAQSAQLKSHSKTYSTHKNESNTNTTAAKTSEIDKTRALTTIRYYTDIDQHVVQAPTRYTIAPANATALCWDGTYSFSHHSRGTCSRHGGVKKWL